MAGTSKTAEPEGMTHSVKWDGLDWAGILDGTRRMGEELHLDLTPTDWIRATVRARLATERVEQTAA